MSDSATPLALDRFSAANALSISVRTLDRLISDGKIKKIKSRGKTIIPTIELQRYLESEMEEQNG